MIPGKLNGILRLHFCVWTDAATAWMGREAWEAIEDPTLNIDNFEGQVCNLGLDLSQTRDITGRALVFEDGMLQAEDGRMLPKFAAFVYGYTPKATIDDRSKIDKAPYDVWARQGFLVATPGPVIRLDIVAADCVADSVRFDVQNVAFDKYLIRRFEDALDEVGGNLPLIEHPQGVSRRRDTPLYMPESIDQLEELILQKRLRVHVNPALRSAVANATFWTSPAGLRRFEKVKATGKIDMLVALVMGVGAAMVPYSEQGSIYDTLGKRDAGRAKSAAGEIDYVALNDISHPGHAEAAAAFKRKQANEYEDD
jgi:phage terminase large subunit-like protein